ncbi:MAG: PCRF domain-containing protein, partial [Candidatus Izemoplasmatales bacterium]
MLTDRLDQLEERYIELGDLMSTSEVATDIKRLTELAKEYSKLEKPVLKYREYKQVLSQLDDLKEMAKDKDSEIREMAEFELDSSKEKIVKLEEELELLLIPKDPNDEKNVIVEIRGAAGGDEANIFAGDLFRMYSKFAESMGWKI